MGSSLRLKIGEELVAYPTDADLVLAAQAGDMESFEQLYRRYFDKLYDFAVRTIRDRHGAADAVQDTFIKAYERIGQLRNPESFRPWIFAIVRREAISGFRVRSREAVTSTLEEEEAALNPLLAQVSDDVHDDPAIAAELSDSAALVWEAAASLDSATYTMLDLHVRQGLSSAEIADVLQISKGNAYTKLNRMKERTGAAISTYLLIRKGSADCDELSELVGDIDLPPVSESLRNAVDRHVRDCDVCNERRKALVAPLKVFAALGMVPPPRDLEGGIWETISGSSDQTGAAPPKRPWRVVAVAALFIAFLGIAAGIAAGFVSGNLNGSSVAVTETAPLADDGSATATVSPSLSDSTLGPGPTEELSEAPAPTTATNGTPTGTIGSDTTVTVPPNTAPVDETPPSINQASISESEIWELDSETLSCPPDTPRSAEVSAEVFDGGSGVESVQATWTIGGSPSTVPMTLTGDVYSVMFGQFTYPTVPDNTSQTIDIVIRARDAVGNESKTTVSIVVNSLAKCFE